METKQRRNRYVTDETLQRELEKQADHERREHRRTRAWVIALTAPSWGAFVGAALGISHIAALATSAVGIAYALSVKFQFLINS